ncbi:type II toxin-antitoxin system RelE family toxin [Sphingobacterium sp. SGR-19]|uniref:type II toxin-antitoxin system RelE family toxin n=1 Tax=Sphingobacterium sp. SGR-19 TaxID=2710886 RepID=UPI0013ED137A|nr:plasmid stabilization protein [Sphingobacterium sp. SGR-19]NGM65774.1 plasmid stabilization protein [Sphingobacterium sp. SGR-19]
MEVIFLRSFLHDIKKLGDKKLKAKIKEFIIELEKSEALEGMSSVKKLKGFSSAYQWRTGDYRLGFYKDENRVELARFVKRNDIYKVFP